MPKPAPYSNTDPAECRSVAIFNYIIDCRLVKSHITIRDKVPNHDGEIELVDESQHPIGSFGVQVRTLPKNFDGSYSCSVELIAYSKIKQPFVLIGVDIQKEVAYWKQIRPAMETGNKDGQKTFTVKFDMTNDIISKDSNSYIQDWQSMLTEYQKSISGIPIIKTEIIAEWFGLESISIDQRLLFQQFIERLNQGFDTDFPVLKEELLPDIWKLGIGILDLNEHGIAYQLYGITYGTNTPLVISLRKEPPQEIFEPHIESYISQKLAMLGITGQNGNEAIQALSTGWCRADFFTNPEKAALDYMLKYLEQGLSMRVFQLYGEALCTEELWTFIENYRTCLCLPISDSYSLDEVEHNIKNNMPRWFKIAIDRLSKSTGLNSFRLDVIELLARQPLNANEEALFQSEIDSTYATVMFTYHPIRLAIHCIKELKTLGHQMIARQYMPNSYEPLWLGTDCIASALETNLKTVLENSIQAYRQFIVRNRLYKLATSSKYLNEQHAIVYVADSSKWTDASRKLDRHIVINSDGLLPKVSFVKPIEVERQDNGRELLIQGRKYKVLQSNIGHAYYLTGNHPLANLVYFLFIQDLNDLYGLSLLQAYAIRT